MFIFLIILWKHNVNIYNKSTVFKYKQKQNNFPHLENIKEMIPVRQI